MAATVNEHVAGVDEAGRGPLAGPVVAAAVILPPGMIINGLKDSKKLSALQRQHLYQIIMKESLAVAVAVIDHKTIDEINIRKASLEAMKQAIMSLRIMPNMVFVDGIDKLDIPIAQQAVVHGDDLIACVSAASVVAKVTRDNMMAIYHNEYPQYDFLHNKGYGTKYHIEAIKQYGLCPIHRRTFTSKFISERNI